MVTRDKGDTTTRPRFHLATIYVLYCIVQIRRSRGERIYRPEIRRPQPVEALLKGSRQAGGKQALTQLGHRDASSPVNLLLLLRVLRSNFGAYELFAH